MIENPDDLLKHNTKDIDYHRLIAEEYDEIVVSPRVTLNDITLNKFTNHLNKGNLMLDLGCGTGHATLRFSRYYKSCIAVDHSLEMLEMAKRNAENQNIRNVKFIRSDVFDFISNCEKFDAVFCIGFLHHLLPSTHNQLISKLKKILNPGGTLFISEPRKMGAYSVPEKISQWNQSSIAPSLHYSCDAIEPDEEHIDENVLLTILKNLDFAVVKKSYHWEIFPQTPKPSFIEKLKMKALNWQYGSTGNVLSILVKNQP